MMTKGWLAGVALLALASVAQAGNVGVQINEVHAMGGLTAKYVTLVPSASYATGGDVLNTGTGATAVNAFCTGSRAPLHCCTGSGTGTCTNDLGLNTIVFGVCELGSDGRTYQIDTTNAKLKAYNPTNVAWGATGGVAGANNTLIIASGVIKQAGTGTAGSQVDVAAQVAATTDLDGGTVKCLIFGR